MSETAAAGVIEESRGSTAHVERPTAKPRLGFAGVGWIGRNRLDAIAAAGLAEIAAIADPFADAMAKVAESHPRVLRAGSFEELLAMDLDGIVIATPSALHAEQSIAAFRRGHAVFCQKPLARTADETAAVIAEARKADRLLGVDLSYRHTAGMQAIRQLIASGELGEIYGVEAVFHNAYGPDKAWFYDRKAAGGGCLLDLGIHLVDLALWVLDFPKVVSASGQVRAHEREGFAVGHGVEDYAAGQLALSNGAVVQLACSWRVPAGCDARIELTFFGTRGGASFRNVDGSFYNFVAEHFLPDRSRRALASPPDAWGGRAAVAWAEQLGRSRAYDREIEHLVDVAATLDRLYEQ
jgi:predicted dehydrogenase